MIPNSRDIVDIVERCKNQHPDAWKNAHTGNAHTEDFIRILAPLLKATDAKWGLNGKRGDPNNISDDALNYLCDASESEGRTPEGLPCVVVDVIIGAGGASPRPGCIIFNTKIEGSGANVDPSSTPKTKPAPPPVAVPVVPGREEALDELTWLDNFYKAPDGLQRPNGLSLDGKPDFLGIAAWYLDVYQRERVNGKSRAEARAAYVNQIKGSDEWKAKHP
jgi:hypothetical protein